MTQIEFTDRYKAAGIDYPDPKTVCPGQCEGVGIYPERKPFVGSSPEAYDLWKAAHRKKVFKTFGVHLFTCDGWHFIKCPDCNGTGRIEGEPSVWGDRKIKPE